MGWEVITVETIPFREQYDVLDEEGELICSFIKTKEKADLIATAPELLDIAEYSLKIVESLPCECDSYNGFTCKKHEWERKLRTTINKAKGSNQDG